MEPTKGTRRPKRSAATKTALERLLAARDRVDEDMVTRRRAEESALENLARATVEAERIEADVQLQLQELDRQRDEVSTRHGVSLAAVDEARGEALLLLTEQGRSAEQLAEMTGFSVKRVRTLVRSARLARSATAAASGDAVRHSEESVSVTDSGEEELLDLTEAGAADWESPPTM